MVEQREESLGEDDAGWSVEPQQEGAWVTAGSMANPAGASGGVGEGAPSRSLRVSAVGAYEIESKKDKSWSTMKKLEEEHRRGLQALREEEAREMQQQQQQVATEQQQQDAAAAGGGEAASVPDVPQADAAAENKPWVSARVLRALEGVSLLRKAKVAPVPSFEGDPDLATAVQINSKQQQQQQQQQQGKKQQQAKKQQQGRRTPSDTQHEDSLRTSPSPKGEVDQQQQQQQQESSTIPNEVEDGPQGPPTTFVFDLQKFVSFTSVSGTAVPFDDELVRAKYETRAPWATLTAGEA